MDEPAPTTSGDALFVDVRCVGGKMYLVYEDEYQTEALEPWLNENGQEEMCP